MSLLAIIEWKKRSLIEFRLKEKLNDLGRLPISTPPSPKHILKEESREYYPVLCSTEVYQLCSQGTKVPVNAGYFLKVKEGKNMLV